MDRKRPWMRAKRAVPWRVAGACLVGTLILVGGADCAQIGSSDPVTDRGRIISDLFNLELVLALVLFLLVGGLLSTIIIRFRGRPGDVDPPQVMGNRKLEVTWTVLPVLVLACLFVLTVRTMNSVDAASPAELPIQVVGHQWWWEFQHRDQGVVTANELHVPVDAPLRLDLQSADVIHSFWLETMGAFTLGVAMLVLFWNIYASLRHGLPAGSNPWDAWTLEWATTSPPPAYNFATGPIPQIRSARPLWDLKHPPDPAVLRQASQAGLSTSPRSSSDARIRRRSGSWHSSFPRPRSSPP